MSFAVKGVSWVSSWPSWLRVGLELYNVKMTIVELQWNRANREGRGKVRSECGTLIIGHIAINSSAKDVFCSLEHFEKLESTISDTC